MSEAIKSEALLTLRLICAELKEVTYKWFKIGVQLGIPHYKLMEFKKEDHPLAAVANYWLNDNVEGVPVSWRSVVAALRSSEENGLAKRIKKKYCQQQDNVGGKDSSCEESVSSVTVSSLSEITSSDNSMFELPDLSQHFPYFPTYKSELTKDELDCLFHNLECHTSKVKAAYSSVICDLQRDLERNSTSNKVINSLKAYDKTLCEKLQLVDCKSIEEVLSKVLDYFSFFDFEIIKVLTCTGSRNSKIINKLKRYKQMFEKYSNRRVVECPDDTFGDTEKTVKDYVLKIDTIHRSLTVEELKKLCHEIANILGHKRLLGISEGCVKLTFRGFEDEYTVTEEQQQALRNVGVLSISYKDQVVDISKKKFEQNEIYLDTECNSDADNDSGFYSEAIKSKESLCDLSSKGSGHLWVMIAKALTLTFTCKAIKIKPSGYGLQKK